MPETQLLRSAGQSTVRWGNVASATTLTLLSLLLLALFSPDLAWWWILTGFEVAGFFAALAFVLLRIDGARYGLLELLLRWRGWAYAPQSSVSRAYLGIVGFLGGKSPSLWKLQPCLPPLPVPELRPSLERWLASVEPVLSADEFAATKRACDEFAAREAPALHRALVERATKDPRCLETSWLWDIWEQFVYLRSREPLAIYSNWYGLDRVDPVVPMQLGRTANIINGMLRFKKLLDTGRLEPNRVQGTTPLCMVQYSRMFGTVREPHRGMDKLVTHTDSRHLLVVCKEHFFKFDVHYADSSDYLTTTDIESQLRRIRDAAEKLDAPVANVAALTGGNRDEWADAREAMQRSSPVNAATLRDIETSLFVVILDDDAPEVPVDLAHKAHHRHGKTLWFDKCFNITVFANGRLVFNGDHTWCDAGIMVHVFDFVFDTESGVDHWAPKLPADDALPQPKHLRFELDASARAAVDKAQVALTALSQALSMRILKFSYFGKGLVKRLGMSPDSFVQMAVQLTYYKLHRAFVLTYETGGMVRFHHGRTETVRSCSMASRRFVLGMVDDKLSPKEKMALLRAAVKQQTRYMRLATNGDGVDRLLLSMKVVSLVQTGAAPAFYDSPGWQADFKLSTSQTPAHGMLGGGFAPLCLDGYGCSYIVSEDSLTFHITSYRMSSTTSAERFESALRSSLADLYELAMSDPNVEKMMSKRVYTVLRSE